MIIQSNRYLPLNTTKIDSGIVNVCCCTLFHLFINKEFRLHFTELGGEKILGKFLCSLIQRSAHNICIDRPRFPCLIVFLLSIYLTEAVIRSHSSDSKPSYNARSVYDLMCKGHDHIEESPEQKTAGDSMVSQFSLAPCEPHQYLSIYDRAIQKHGESLYSFVFSVGTILFFVFHFSYLLM